jgi:hypothetical protein
MIGGFVIKYDKHKCGLCIEVWRTNGKVTCYPYNQTGFDRIVRVTRYWTDSFFRDRIITKRGV